MNLDERIQEITEMGSRRQREAIKALILEERLQSIGNLSTRYKSARIQHTLDTPVEEWEREFDTFDRVSMSEIKELEAQRNVIKEK